MLPLFVLILAPKQTAYFHLILLREFAGLYVDLLTELASGCEDESNRPIPFACSPPVFCMDNHGPHIRKGFATASFGNSNNIPARKGARQSNGLYGRWDFIRAFDYQPIHALM